MRCALHELVRLPGVELHRQRLRKRSVLPATGCQAMPPGEHQHRAAALIDELFQQPVLLRPQAGCLEAADDDGVVREQLGRFVRESLDQLTG